MPSTDTPSGGINHLGRVGSEATHIERRHNKKCGLDATDNFNDGDTIQYRLLNTMYTGYTICQKGSGAKWETKLNTIVQYCGAKIGNYNERAGWLTQNINYM